MLNEGVEFHPLCLAAIEVGFIYLSITSFFLHSPNKKFCIVDVANITDLDSFIIFEYNLLPIVIDLPEAISSDRRGVLEYPSTRKISLV